MTETEFRKRLKQVKYFSNWKASEVMVKCKKTGDKEKKELIVEFLKDWRWGNVVERHFQRFETKPNLMMRCKCVGCEYWVWFEEKWEAKLK